MAENVVWRFNDITIPHVETEEDKSITEGRVILNCVAWGDVKYTSHKLSSSFTRQVDYPGEKVEAGRMNLTWDGETDVFLAGRSNDPDDNEPAGDSDLIEADDRLRINNDKKIIDFFIDCEHGTKPQPPTLLNDILEVGDNEIVIEVEDVCGNTIGCTDLYIITKKGREPTEETDIFKLLSCTSATNETANNGQRILMANGGKAYTLTDGLREWDACLLRPRLDDEDEKANEYRRYVLEFVLGDERLPSSYGICYIPGHEYSNLESCQYTNPLCVRTHVLNDKIGRVVIKNQHYKIIRADVWGRCFKLPAYVDINGEVRHWHNQKNKHLFDEPENLIFRFKPEQAASVLNIQTSDYLDDNMHLGGAEIFAICVYESLNMPVEEEEEPEPEPEPEPLPEPEIPVPNTPEDWTWVLIGTGPAGCNICENRANPGNPVPDIHGKVNILLNDAFSYNIANICREIRVEVDWLRGGFEGDWQHVEHIGQPWGLNINDKANNLLNYAVISNPLKDLVCDYNFDSETGIPSNQNEGVDKFVAWKGELVSEKPIRIRLWLDEPQEIKFRMGNGGYPPYAEDPPIILGWGAYKIWALVPKNSQWDLHYNQSNPTF